MPTAWHLVTDGCTRGAERTAIGLAGALRSARWEHEVFAIRDSRRDVAAGMPVTVLSRSRSGFVGSPWSHVVAATRLASIMWSRQPDVVLAHGAAAALVTVVACAASRRSTRRSGRTRIVWQRISPLNEGSGVVQRALLRRTWRLLSGAVDAVVCITSEDAEQARRLGARLVEVIDNHRPAVDFAPTPERLRRRSSGRVFLFVGVLDANKQPDHFVELARIWRRSHPHDRFELLGDGPLRPQVQRHADQGVVEVRGHLDDVRSALWSADALVVCSRSESATGAAVEAALAGLPVFAYPLHGLAEIARRSGGEVAAGRAPGDLVDAIAGRIDELGRDAATRARYADRCAAAYDSTIAHARYTSLLDRMAGSEEAGRG